MARFTERTITSAERFEAEADRVRGQGFAVSVGEADLAYTCLAVALPERGDGIVHALSVSLPTADFGRRQGRSGPRSPVPYRSFRPCRNPDRPDWPRSERRRRLVA